MNKRVRDAGLFLLLLSFTAAVVALILLAYTVNSCAPAPSGGCAQGWSTLPLAPAALWPAILAFVLFVAGVGVLAANRERKAPVSDDDLDATW